VGSAEPSGHMFLVSLYYCIIAVTYCKDDDSTCPKETIEADLFPERGAQSRFTSATPEDLNIAIGELKLLTTFLEP
jgi:hypothetical protein